jgi:queuine tRNA-ribosyltransferase
MGVGGFEEFRVAIECGIDLFDCVIPTRNARNAYLFRLDGPPVRIRNRSHQEDTGPIEEGCDCPVCARFSRGFLHHLFGRREMLGPVLATIHNLRAFHRFLERARAAIAAGEWPGFRAEVASLEAAHRADAADPEPPRGGRGTRGSTAGTPRRPPLGAVEPPPGID